METLANQLKGLSDPTRLRIINLLKDGELCVCDIIAIIDAPQSTISRHLAYLRKTNWVETERVGKWMHYRRPAQPTPFQAYALTMLDDEFSHQRMARCDNDTLAERITAKAGGTCADLCED